MLADGVAAPDFELPTDDGKLVQLTRLRGKPVVIYFYPSDDTPTCTNEAKDFSCLIDGFKAAGAEVIGISPDSAASHRKFKTKHDLQLRLAADEQRTVAEAYGVWVEKTLFGRKYMGVERATFLVDKSGRLVRSWRKVRVRGHAEEVLAAVKALKR